MTVSIHKSDKVNLLKPKSLTQIIAIGQLPWNKIKIHYSSNDRGRYCVNCDQRY